MGKITKLFFVALFFLAAFIIIRPENVSAQQSCVQTYTCQQYVARTCYNAVYTCGSTPYACWQYIGGRWHLNVCYSYSCGWSYVPYNCSYWQTTTCTRIVPCVPPTIQFEAIPSTVTSGGSTLLAWAAANATSCYAVGWQGFWGTVGTSGIRNIYNLTESQWFVLQCTGPGGSTNAWVYVTVQPPSPPTVSYFYASPNSIAYNGSTTLVWASQNAAVCWGYAGKDFAGFLLLPSGSKTITGLTSSQTFTIACTNSNMTLWSSQSSVYVTVQRQPGLTAVMQICAGGNWVTTAPACLARSSCTQVVACVPNCAGKTCGSDGCGGVCGTCSSPQTCGGGGNANLCGCTPTTSCAAQGRTCGSINNGCGIEVCGGACPVCGDGVCSGGESAATCPSDCGNILSGTVYTDTAGNSCASGATAYSGGATVTLYTGASPSGSGVSNGSGAYSFISTIPAGQKTATVSNVSGTTVGAVRYQGGAWGTTNLSGYTYGPFTHNSSQTLDWCLTSIKPWYQVDKGDVRRVSLANKVPAGQYLSTDVNYPGIAISSAWSTDFGLGQASAKNWKIDDEYSYNKNSSNKNGSVAYSYYKSRVSSTNQTISSIPGCANGGSASCSISNLTSGIYEFDGGGTSTLTITGYAHSAGAHVTLLVNGNVTIASNISIPEGAGNLLVLAAKGNITIDKSVGQVSVSSVTTNIDGIYSAEGKITIDGDTCPAGTPDRRLNVGGVLIANSKKPFTTGGFGIIDNKRSLCSANDATYPSLYVKSRFDFLFQLTDFYLVPTGRYSQVQP